MAKRGGSSGKAGGANKSNTSGQEAWNNRTTTGGKLMKTDSGFYGQNDNGVSATVVKNSEGYAVIREHSPETFAEAREINPAFSEPPVIQAKTLTEAKSYAKGWLDSRKRRDFA